MLQNNSALKSLIARLWNNFWSGGISNPLTAIEQITYLLFMKQMDDLEAKRERDAEFTGEPYESKFVRTYISEMMESTDQGAFIDQYGLRPFEVKVLHPRRTLCEKIMSLVRFSYSDDAINDLKKKIRHVYDIHQLLQNKKLNSFFQSGDFEEMLSKVAQDDKTSYKSNNQWLKNHPKDAMIFKDLEDIWNGLSETYNGDFKNLVHGDLPNFLDVLATMKMVKEKIGSIGWPIKVEKI